MKCLIGTVQEKQIEIQQDFQRCCHQLHTIDYLQNQKNETNFNMENINNVTNTDTKNNCNNDQKDTESYSSSLSISLNHLPIELTSPEKTTTKTILNSTSLRTTDISLPLGNDNKLDKENRINNNKRKLELMNNNLNDVDIESDTNDENESDSDDYYSWKSK